MKLYKYSYALHPIKLITKSLPIKSNMIISNRDLFSHPLQLDFSPQSVKLSTNSDGNLYFFPYLGFPFLTVQVLISHNSNDSNRIFKQYAYYAVWKFALQSPLLTRYVCVHVLVSLCSTISIESCEIWSMCCAPLDGLKYHTSQPKIWCFKVLKKMQTL